MRPEQIQELVDRVPFLPFRITLTSGDSVEISARHSLAVMRTQLFVVLPEDRWKWIPLQQIASVETLQAA